MLLQDKIEEILQKEKRRGGGERQTSETKIRKEKKMEKEKVAQAEPFWLSRMSSIIHLRLQVKSKYWRRGIINRQKCENVSVSSILPNIVLSFYFSVYLL